MKKIYFILFCLVLMPKVSAAHFIVGIANNALDGTNADDRIVVLWSAASGISDNLTDVIGANGNSGVPNTYMIDCELLNSGCDIGNEIKIKVLNSEDKYISNEVNLSVTGAGYDIAPNITLNSPPNITFIIVDDSMPTPENEIDLLAASSRVVTCEAIAEDIDGEEITNASAIFFGVVSSNYTGSDDNNDHYTNNSCYVNLSYGNENQSKVSCTFDVWYYANSEQWKCIIIAENNMSQTVNSSDIVFINTLLSVGLPSTADFGFACPYFVSNETAINITNYGNVKINISFLGFAVSQNDGYSMNCSLGSDKNISVEYMKYNLTDSNPGFLSLQDFELKYTNLTSTPVIEKFNLDYRKEDSQNNAINTTYWRVYVPEGIAGDCRGNIIFGVNTAPET